MKLMTVRQAIAAAEDGLDTFYIAANGVQVKTARDKKKNLCFEVGKEDAISQAAFLANHATESFCEEKPKLEKPKPEKPKTDKK